VHSWISTNRPDLADKIVIITGDYANEETVSVLRSIGALYLEKPFRVQDLIAAVEKTMGKVGGPNGAAALLGMSRSTLLFRMQKLSISASRVIINA